MIGNASSLLCMEPYEEVLFFVDTFDLGGVVLLDMIEEMAWRDGLEALEG